MDDLISRQAAIEVLEEPCKVPETWTDEYAVGERAQYEKDVKALKSLAFARPELLPPTELRGRWMTLQKYSDEYYCSVCGKMTKRNRTPFCGWCGTKMEGEQNER